MARGPRLGSYGQNAGAMASSIAHLIMSGGQAVADLRAQTGRSLGAGIAGIGERKREAKVRAEAKAERDAERAEARSEREQARADRAAERNEARERWERNQEDETARRDETARHNKALERLQEMAMEARGAEARLREAEDRAAQEAYEMQVRQATEGVVGPGGGGGGGGVPPSADVPLAPARTWNEPDAPAPSPVPSRGPPPATDILAPLRARAQQAQRDVPAAVLAEQADGSYVDLIDPSLLLEREKAKYQGLVALLGKAKKPADVFALRAAMKVMERRMDGLAGAAQAQKQDAAVAKQKADEVRATRERTTAQTAARVTIEAEARRLGIDPSALIDRFRGDILAGRPPSPETIRAVAKSMEKPTPEQEGAERVAKDEGEHAARMALPEARRREMAEQEFDQEEARIRAAYRKILIDYPDRADEMEGELAAMAQRIGAKYGIRQKAQPITGF